MGRAKGRTPSPRWTPSATSTTWTLIACATRRRRLNACILRLRNSAPARHRLPPGSLPVMRQNRHRHRHRSPQWRLLTRKQRHPLLRRFPPHRHPRDLHLRQRPLPLLRRRRCRRRSHRSLWRRRRHRQTPTCRQRQLPPRHRLRLTPRVPVLHQLHEESSWRQNQRPP